MEEVSIIGVNLAKHVFQVHGAQADGSMAFSKKLSRNKLLSFLASQPRCVVAMEACAGSHLSLPKTRSGSIDDGVRQE
jgi:transposase